MTPEERFFQCVDEVGECWLWLSTVTKNGYGQFHVGGRRPYAHRWSYEHFVAPIPPGLTIDHLCRNRSCVNPGHLEAVPLKVNILRGDSAGARNSRKTHCPKGHPYDGTYRGNRICLVCKADWNRQRQRGKATT